MNIVITGSLGHISKPLTEALVKKEHAVTVISSKEDRRKDIEAIGAKPAIGSIFDVEFLSPIFSRADIVYLMEPPVNFFDQHADTHKYWTGIAKSYAAAIERSGVTKVIHLSSIGAHTDKGNGMLAAHYYVENILKELPRQVSIKFMRPVGFYVNMFAYMSTIRSQNAIIQNYGGDKKEPWVAPLDIAAVIGEEMEKPFDGRTIRYIASDEVSPNEIANILGNAIGNPGVQWITVPDDQFENGLIAAGFNAKIAKGLTEMNAGRRNDLYDDYYQHKPIFGKTKLVDFAKVFAAMYKQQ